MGERFHHVLRQIAERAKALGRDPSAEEIDRILAEEFYLPFANQPTVERMSSAARRLVTDYLTRYREDLERVWATERPFEWRLEDGSLAGRADVILTAGGGDDGSLAIVDYKTATDARREEHYRLQLAVCAAAGRAEGLPVDAAYLHDLKDSSRKPVDVSPAATAEAVARVAASVKGIRAGAFEAKPEPEKCCR